MIACLPQPDPFLETKSSILPPQPSRDKAGQDIHPSKTYLAYLANTLVFALLMSACATVPPPGEGPQAQPRPTVTITPAPARPGKPAPAAADEFIPIEAGKPEEERRRTISELRPGTGTFINTREIYRKRPVEAEKGEYTLNFEATDLQEVVKIILGDVLKKNYFIDPRVTGAVTIQTSQPLTKQQLLPVLENLLRLNGAALMQADGIYKIVPLPQARGALKPVARGYGTRIVPLRHISAREMGKLIEPFLSPDAPKPLIDDPRNVMILSGSEQELQNLMEMIEVFDVDWLQGMSLGLFRLQNAEAKTLAGELEKVFLEKDSPLTGMLRLVPIERLNALLVISQRPDYLQKAGRWIERLDEARDTVTPRLYVYRVKNGKASNLALVIGGIFGVPAKPPAGAPPPQLAPGETPVQIQAPGQESQTETLTDQAIGTGTGISGFGAPTGTPGFGAATGYQAGGVAGGTVGGAAARQAVPPTVIATEKFRIVADDSNNSLVIFASPKDFQMIEAALRHLDVVPLQVLIEASVIEVTLRGALSYGVEWFFKNRFGGGSAGFGALSSGTAGAKIDTTGAAQAQGSNLAALTSLFTPGGFTYAVINSQNQVTVLIDLLASQSKVNVLSSPSLMVLDNQSATIRVVDQFPVITQQQQPIAIAGGQANILNSVQYVDIGVILEVTPRINLGGRITLDLVQDVSNVSPDTGVAGNPIFQKRNIQSAVTVQSSETLVLGGLIRDRKSTVKTGVPFVMDIPILGRLFSSTNNESERTELIVLMTPKAVRTQEEARSATDEFRSRLKQLETERPGQYYRRGMEDIYELDR